MIISPIDVFEADEDQPSGYFDDANQSTKDSLEVHFFVEALEDYCYDDNDDGGYCEREGHDFSSLTELLVVHLRSYTA